MGKGIVLCVFLGIAFPILTSAQGEGAFLLSEKDTKGILGALQSEVSEVGTTIDILDYSPQQQAALTLFRSSSRETILKFLPGFVGTETVEVIIDVASSLGKFSKITVKQILEEIERQTVEKAIEIGNAWLFQNEIKVGSGSIEYKDADIAFQYLITYKSISQERAEIVLEFYSPDPINNVAPRRGSIGTFVGSMGDSQYSDTINPFLIHIETRIERFALGWMVDSSADTKITVEFPEKVPRLQLAKELPYPLEEQKIKLLNYLNTAKRIFDILQSVGSEVLGKTADFAHKVKETIIKGVIVRTSQLLSRGGAGLVADPFSKESQQVAFIESQLNQVKDVLDVKESQLKLGETKDEAQPVENLIELSFPQEQRSSDLPPVSDSLPAPDLSILDSVKEEQKLIPDREETLDQTESDLVIDEETKLEEKLSLVKDEVVVTPIAWCVIDPARGPGLSNVIFSEIAWMGSVNSANDEWMKLKNISNGEINLAGWQLQDADSQIQISLGEEYAIPSQGVFILERTNDDSLPGTQAHVIYTGALNNTNEALYLFDEKCVLRDKVVADPHWLAGDSASRKPMQRNNDLSWYTLGVAQSQTTPSPQPAQMISGSLAPPPSPVVSYPKILISEIQIEGDTTKDEFIELYNPTDQAVNLSSWSLKRKTSTGSDANLVSSSAFSGTVGAYGYFLIVPQLNDDGTPNYKGSATPDLFYSGKTYSIASDNVVFLYNPNEILSDKVGFGAATEAEGSPAPNPPAGKSLNRIWDTVNQTYYDRDNNSIDFIIHNPTSPKAQNIEDAPPPPAPQEEEPPAEEPQSEEQPPPEEPPAEEPQSSQDTIPPQVTLNPIDSLQNNVSFSLSWIAVDPTGDAAPSGVQSIFVEYSVTPSASGVFLQYDNNGVWTNWQAGSTGKITLSAQTTSLSLRVQDGVNYTFQISASDVAGNTSAVISASTSVALLKTVVINEVAWVGTKAQSTDEWLELFNTTGAPVDLTGWKIISSDSVGPEITFSGTIAANSFYLVERTDDQATTATAQLTASFGNGLSNSACEVLYLHNAENTVVDQTVCKSDGTWPAGTASPDYISMERIVSTTAGSSASNWASNNRIQYNSKDVDNNWINGTPGATNTTSVSSTTIGSATLRFDEFSTLTLTTLGSPYVTTASITIPAGKTLVVEPGVTVKFKDNTAHLTVQGTLKAQGTQTNGIIFTVTDGGAIWCGINVTSTSTLSQLDYVTIDKAQSLGGGCNVSFINYAMYVDSSAVAINNSIIQTGSYHRKLYLKNSNSTVNTSTISGATLNADSVGIYIDGGSPTISNSTISNNSIGIFVNSLSNNPIIQSNTFTGNTQAVKLSSASAALSGNTATNNTYNGILFEGAVLSNMTWQADTIPYIVNKFTVSAGVTLTIQAGAVVKFINTPSTESEITVQGTLITQGTQASPVAFAGITDATAWKRIYIASGSTGSQLTYTTISRGGNTYYEAALYVKQSDVQLSNVVISNSAQSAIYSSSGAITGSNVTLSSNTYGFHIAGACPALSTVTVTGTLLHPSSAVCSF